MPGWIGWVMTLSALSALILGSVYIGVGAVFGIWPHPVTPIGWGIIAILVAGVLFLTMAWWIRIWPFPIQDWGPGQSPQGYSSGRPPGASRHS